MSRGNRKRLGAIERDILEQLSVGDVVYASLFSARSTKIFYKLARERATRRYRHGLALQRLMDENFVRIVDEKLSITKAGLSMLGRAINANVSLLQTAQWDKKWRIAAFDIPEKYASLRDRVRHILKRAGFVQFQQSVWIFPHECQELVQLIKAESRLSKHILYGVLEKIEDEDRLKRHFSLR